MDQQPSVSIIGMGFVGLTLAVFMANKGVRVYGIETNQDVYNKIVKENPHFYEKGLTEAFQKVMRSKKLSIHLTHPQRVSSAPHTYIITVGTPIRNGAIQTESFENAVKELRLNLLDGDTIISRSTMGIGMTRSLLLEQLNDFPNCKVAACPERTIEGDALNELLRLPQLVGGDESSKESALNLFREIGILCVDGGSLEQVEFIKLMTNTFRDTLFAIANEFAMFAEDLGLSFDEISKVAKEGYPRMDSLRTQGPSSGPCLSKDPIIMSASSHSHRNKGMKIVESARITNFEVSSYAIHQVLKVSPNCARFGILGLAFKGRPETNDTRDSFSNTLVQELLQMESTLEISSFDPMGSKIDFNDSRYQQKKSAKEVLLSSDCIFITNNHEYFSSQEFLHEFDDLEGNFSGIVYDLWGNLKLPNIGNWKIMKFGG